MQDLNRTSCSLPGNGTDKINRNKDNDAKAVKALKKEGWKVITVWECKLKPDKVQKVLKKILFSISG
jgi:DNA mismatch endonuclease (patch repair protein)